MIDDLLKEVKGLKNDAKLLRDIGDTGGAIAVMDQAIEKVQAAANESVSAAESDRLKAELADCWGIKGGILRRAGKLPEALAAYKTGLDFESGDSYNLTNSLVLELLINPAQLQELKARIEKARDEVETQKEARKGQWWFWADLALLDLLSGEEEGALDAYKQVSDSGARASDYDSILAVLEELSARFAGSNVSLRASLERASAFLKRLKP